MKLRTAKESPIPRIPERESHSSMEYVRKFQDLVKTAGALPETPSKEALAKILQAYRDPKEHLQKIGQAMVAPILVKLKYEGVVRNILVETPLGKGEAPEYDVLDTLGLAYILNQSEGQVMVRRFEGKRVHVDLFHVASFPVVGKDDIYALRADIIKYAKDFTEDDIRKKEDIRLFALLNVALTDYATHPLHTVTTNHVVDNSGRFANTSFNAAMSITASHELQADRIIINNQEFYDLYYWTIDQGGWKLKDDIVYGVPIVRYGDLQITKSIVVTPGTALVTPAPEYLGYMPVRYSLEAVEYPRPDYLEVGWVLDELIGMLIVNPRGVVKINKI